MTSRDTPRFSWLHRKDAGRLACLVRHEILARQPRNFGLMGRAFPGQEIPRTGGRPPVPGISSCAGWARPAGPAANAVRMFAVAAWIARRTAGWVTPDA